MPCLFPVGVYKVNGILQNKTRTLMLRPCGQCMSCRLQYARDWSLRCYHETQLHEENCFLTLTYDDEHLPKDGSIDKKVLSKFIKELRRKLEPKRIRFFGCGEYGSKKMRPHYHVMIFGHDFEDKEVLKAGQYRRYKNRFKTGIDHTLYISKELSKIWPYGFHTIGETSLEAANYIARYITKKIKGNDPEAEKRAKERYGDREKEFCLMSRMPGIGKKWLEKNHQDIYPKDFITINGRKYRPPRYYDQQYARLFPYRFDAIKKSRLEKMKLEFPDEGESLSRNKYRETLTKKFERQDL